MTEQEYEYYRDITRQQLNIILSIKKISLTEVRYDEVVADTISLFFQYYISKNKHVFYLNQVLKMCIKKALWGRGACFNENRVYSKTVQFDEIIEHSTHTYNQEIEYDMLECIQDHKYNEYILFLLYSKKQYKAAILAIEKLTGRDWIYKHATPLRKIWEILHYERRKEMLTKYKNRSKG